LEVVCKIDADYPSESDLIKYNPHKCYTRDEHLHNQMVRATEAVCLYPWETIMEAHLLAGDTIMEAHRLAGDTGAHRDTVEEDMLTLGILRHPPQAVLVPMFHHCLSNRARANSMIPPTSIANVAEAHSLFFKAGSYPHCWLQHYSGLLSLV